MNPKKHGRRKFLKDGVALAGLAVGAVASSSAQIPASDLPEAANESLPYGVRSKFETTARLKDGTTTSSRSPLSDSMGIITASGLHMKRTHNNPTPEVDPGKHRLMIHGLVDHPLVFTMDELKRMPSVSRIHFLMCAGNTYLNKEYRHKIETVEETHGKTSCSEWTGVLLSTLLNEVGVQKGASWLVAEGAEVQKHTISIPLSKAMDDVLVAYGQNGEAVRPEQGYPVRLIVPGWEGVRNVKWLRRIKVVDQPYMTKWETARYTNMRLDGKSRWFQFELEPNSVITRPSGGHRLPGRGFVEITGLAWAGGGAVRRVEVSLDGGRKWKDAQLQSPVLPMAHTRFRFPWNWNGEEAVIVSRCTDEFGAVQPTRTEMEKIWQVTPDYWLSSTNIIQHWNACQPWKITTEGSVRNAIWEI